MKNIFSEIPKDLDAEVFEQLVKSDNVRIERIISKGHRSPESGWYDQDQNEWVMVLQGKATVSFEEDPDITLKSGDYVNIKSHQKHKVTWTDPSIETIWLAVFY